MNQNDQFRNKKNEKVKPLQVNGGVKQLSSQGNNQDQDSPGKKLALLENMQESTSRRKNLERIAEEKE